MNNPKKIKKKLNIKIKSIVLITIIIILLMIASAFFEITGSRDSFSSLLNKEANSLITILSKSAENTLYSNAEVENLTIQRIKDDGKTLAMLDSMNLLNHKNILKILNEYSISSFILIDRNGKIGYSPFHSRIEKIEESLVSLSKPILIDNEESIVIGTIDGFDSLGYFVSIKRPKDRGGAFILGINPNYFLEFRKKIGVGKLIQNISNEEDIEYIVLQDEYGIISSSRNNIEFNSIQTDVFLQKGLKNDSVYSRIYYYGGNNILEVIKSLYIGGEFYGIFRLGLSMRAIDELDSKMIRRIIILSLILITIGIVLSSLLIVNQHYSTLQHEFKKIQNSREKILDNIADGVIAFDKNKKVIFANKVFDNLFEVKLENIIQKDFSTVFNSEELISLFEKSEEVQNKEVIIRSKNGKKLILNISFSLVYNDQNEFEFSILVIQDVTAPRMLSLQLQRNEKLVAVGELAAGVAHEIRNPLNSIAILIQRMKHEIEPKENNDIFTKFLTTIKQEISRLNSIIEQFLKFSKRPTLNLAINDLSDLILETIDFVSHEAEMKNIIISKSIIPDVKINIDKEQIKQVLLNIFRNAFEAMENGGKLKIILKTEKENSILEIIDAGCGIPKENLNKIFNIYYSTKPAGSGLGLGLVNQIISEHDARIEVESEVGVGTKFKIIFTGK